MKNLYSFSKDAWFVRLYKWLYNVDLTQKYKNMCPMFWALVITFILLPIVVTLKLCGNLSKVVYSYLDKKKEEKYQKRKAKFLEYCNRELTPEEAYNLYNSKDWMTYSGGISYDLCRKIYDLSKQYKPIYKKKLDIDTDLILIGFLFTLLLGLIAFGIFYIKWEKIDWNLLGKALLYVINIIVLAVGFRTIFKYLFFNSIVFGFFDKVWDFINNIASKVWHGIQIVSDMIYNIYKKNCPLIEWTEEDNKI